MLAGIMKPLALVVENDGGTRRLLDVLLSRFGLETDLVPSGSDALLLLERVRYDLIFLDLMVPGSSGMDVLAWLQERQPDILPRCVVLSSAPNTMVTHIAQKWPRLRVLRKPFELSEVTDAAQQAVDRAVERQTTAIEEFTRRSIRAGAKSGIVLQSVGPTLHEVMSFGYTREMLAKYWPLAVDSPYPICLSFRHQRPIWIASVALAEPEYPLLVPVWKENDSRALATIPLVRDGVPVGVAGWAFREPRLFSEPERKTFDAIAAFVTPHLPQSASQARA